MISFDTGLLDDAPELSKGGLKGTRGMRISFCITMPDQFVVVIVLWVVALANTAESGPIALV